MGTRRHAAPGGRALATGLTVSATFGIVAGFASHQPAPAGDTVSAADTAPVATEQPTTSAAAAPATAPPRTTIVERVVHRTIEVDESGVPLAPPATAAASPAPAPPESSAPAAPAPAPAATTPPPPPTAAPPPPPTTATPTCSGSKC